jgi:hypothetical protein
MDKNELNINMLQTLINYVIRTQKYHSNPSPLLGICSNEHADLATIQENFGNWNPFFLFLLILQAESTL